MPGAIDQVPISRRRLLAAIKRRGSATIADLAAEMGLSGEAVRQQLAGPERDLWIERENLPPSGEAGRPAGRYRLTPRGEQLFPKQHATLALALIDSIRAELGDVALTRVLAHITDARVAALVSPAPARAAGEPVTIDPEPLEKRVERLRTIYGADDPFLEVTKTEGGYLIIERNCPFLDVALQRPLLCSSTVTVLARVLGRRVVREERFQEGHGRCVFRVFADQPVDTTNLRFTPEPPSLSLGRP